MVSQALINVKENNSDKALSLLDEALALYPYEVDGIKLLKEIGKSNAKADNILTNRLKGMEIPAIL